MKRSYIKRGRRPRRTAEEMVASAAWHLEVMRASDGRCVVTGEKAEECHHVLSQMALKKRGLHAHLWDARNGIALTTRIHARHTTRIAPIPLDLLPKPALEFARELGLEHLIERAYPEQELAA